LDTRLERRVLRRRYLVGQVPAAIIGGDEIEALGHAS
jgi:hypothetical protein